MWILLISIKSFNSKVPKAHKLWNKYLFKRNWLANIGIWFDMWNNNRALYKIVDIKATLTFYNAGKSIYVFRIWSFLQIWSNFKRILNVQKMLLYFEFIHANWFVWFWFSFQNFNTTEMELCHFPFSTSFYHKHIKNIRPNLREINWYLNESIISVLSNQRWI